MMSSGLPQGWEEKTLKDVTSILGDGLHGTPQYIENGEYFFVNGNNLVNGKIIINEKTKSCSKEEYDKYKKNLTNRTLFVSINGTLGNIAEYNNEKIFLGKSACYFNILESFDKNFIKYILHTNYFKHYINTYSTGTTIKNMPLKAMREFCFNIPSDINEQKRIADILFAFDDKIELNNQMNKTLESMATALFKEWFENFNFPNDKGKAYKKSGGEFKSSELGEIPIDWEVCKIEDNVEILGGGTPSTKNESYWIGGDINWFSPTDITKFNSMFYSKSAKKININGLNNSSAKEFPPYSLMLTSRATVGEIGINTETATTNQGFITLIPNEKFPLKYLYFWLYSKIDEIHSLASGSTFKEISKRDFKKLKILKFNKQLLDLFEKRVNPIFEKIENNQKENDSLKNLRDEFLPKLMSGEKRV